MPAPVTIKTEGSLIDGTPEKRVFWSIISDYGLKTGLCELIDNALDLWTRNGKRKSLRIRVVLDADRQLAAVEDNAGGVAAADLRLLIAPGGSQNAPTDSVIGVFGVGSKRASVAIGEHVEIKTRHRTGNTLQLDITKDWLNQDDWDIPSYEVPNIPPGTTRVEITQMRRTFTESDVVELTEHFSATYARFLIDGCVIEVNDVPLEPLTFANFAFPPDYPPQTAGFTVPMRELGDVRVTLQGGLIFDRDAEGDNYGVYFYCNERLIVRDLKTRDVGYYVSAEAGVPHPDASLARVIVQIEGAARAMPWNSSKSGIDTDHPLFQHIRPSIIQLAGYFSSLSRRLKDDWERQVFQYTEGEFCEAHPPSGEPPRFVMAQLPRVNKSRVEHYRDRNRSVIKNKPWTLGLVEGMAAVDVVLKQRFDTRHRLALILLDSNFEIALKEFIVHETTLFPPATYNDAKISQLFARRNLVINELRAKMPQLKASDLAKAQHFYLIRNKVIHERASAGVTENDVKSYRETVEAILRTLFSLRFS